MNSYESCRRRRDKAECPASLNTPEILSPLHWIDRCLENGSKNTSCVNLGEFLSAYSVTKKKQTETTKTLTCCASSSKFGAKNLLQAVTLSLSVRDTTYAGNWQLQYFFSKAFVALLAFCTRDLLAVCVPGGNDHVSASTIF